MDASLLPQPTKRREMPLTSRLSYSGVTMGVVGHWDASLFERYRAARGGVEEMRALDALARANEGLVLTLARELRSDSRTPGIERLEWGDLAAVCRIGFVRAMQELDPDECGDKPATFIKWKMLAELQKEIAKCAAVIRGQKQRPPDVVYLESDDDAGAVVMHQTRCHVKPQVRAKIYVSKKDVRRIADESLVGESTIWRFVGGTEVSTRNEKRIRTAMTKLKIAGPERRGPRDCESGTMEVAEPVPQSA